ncbi:hypothetical protein [Luteibacter rhizovicinus]|nr:hypothetical protein [Luteibacter rhizovicinus]
MKRKIMKSTQDDISSFERAKLDPAFGDNGILWLHAPDATQTFAKGLSTTADGSIFISLACRFGQHAPDGVGIAKIGPDGEVDPDFGTQGYAIYPEKAARMTPFAPLILPNGDMLIRCLGGDAYKPMLMRILADGSVDESFADGGVQTFDLKDYRLIAADVVPMDDGRILVFGRATHKVIGSTDGIVIRLLENGQLDLSFHQTGMLSLSFRGDATTNASLGLLVDDKYLLAGGTETEALIRRYHLDGQIDTSFGVAGEYALPSSDINTSWAAFNDLLVTPEGKLIGVGDQYLDRYSGFLVGLDANGHADPDFAEGKVLFTPPRLGTSTMSKLALDTSGRVVVYVDLSSEGFVLGRYSASGALDETFGDRGYLYIGFGEARELSLGFAIQGTRGILVSGQIVNTAPPMMNRAIIMRVPHA